MQNALFTTQKDLRYTPIIPVFTHIISILTQNFLILTQTKPILTQSKPILTQKRGNPRVFALVYVRIDLVCVRI